MFWTDWGTVARIETASMDGTNRRTLISRNLRWPNGITVDYSSSGALFWSDAGLDKIETSDIHGHNRRVRLC